jgi:hypothetical protein
MVVLGVALALAACAQPQTQASGPAKQVAPRDTSESASISASDAALLAALEYPTSQSAVATALPVGERRLSDLWRELTAAPFVAETTATLPGSFDAVDIDVPKAPKRRARTPDRYEPNNALRRATLLRLGSAQVHTISSSKDADWIALPSIQGGGFYYVAATGDFWIDTVLQPGRAPSDEDGSWDEDVYYHCTPSTDTTGVGRYTWLKITAEKPIAYRIVYLRSAPKRVIGEYGPLADELVSSIADIDVTRYLETTGRHATDGQLMLVREELLGARATDAIGSIDVTQDENSQLQRMFWRFRGVADPICVWTMAGRREDRQVIVSVGRDGTWGAPRYASKWHLYSHMLAVTEQYHRGGKPAIYLYPRRPQRVMVKLGYEGLLTTTAPVIDGSSDSWTVIARPDGTLTDSDDRRWPYLFWEGLGLPAFDLSRGQVVRGTDVDVYLRRALAERGLSAHEGEQFREFWVPRLSANPWVLIHFAGGEYERYAPLDLTPKPDVSIRVFMVARPLEVPVAVKPQRLAPPPKRRGFTLVEWGGTILP